MSGGPGRGATLGVRFLALRILADVAAGAYVDRALAEREGRLAEARDRRFLHLLVLSTLRWQGALDALLGGHVHGGARRLEPAVRAALRTGLFEAAGLGRPPAIAVSATVDAVRDVAGDGAARLVNAVLRRTLSGGVPVLDERRTIPGWLFERWRRAYGDARAGGMLRAINRPARPFLVARPGAGQPAALLARLSAAGVDAAPAPWHPRGVGVRSGSPAASGCFEDGDAVAVDPAAALVARLAAPPGGRGPIADLAAAPGGKAALLAWDSGAELVALEIDATRAERAACALRVACGPDRIAVVRGDAGRPPLAPGAFRLVLLDAPCSGTGTLRRRPDLRWRLRAGGIRSAARLQSRLLEQAACLVAPGGALVYSVCSLEPEEGVRQVERLLARRPDLRAEAPDAWLGPEAREFLQDEPPSLLTRPDVAEVDGFFAARLARSG